MSHCSESYWSILWDCHYSRASICFLIASMQRWRSLHAYVVGWSVRSLFIANPSTVNDRQLDLGGDEAW